MWPKRAGCRQVKHQPTGARPDQPRADTRRPGQGDHGQQADIGKRARDLDPRSPGHLHEDSPQHDEPAGRPFHAGMKSVITSTRLMLAGSLLQTTSAWSVVEESRWLTLATWPTTKPRGYPPPTPLVKAHSPLDATAPRRCSIWT